MQKVEEYKPPLSLWEENGVLRTCPLKRSGGLVTSKLAVNLLVPDAPLVLACPTCAPMALTKNSATIANGASTVIGVAALGIRSRHNYIGSIRGKGIECPRTLANLRLPQHWCPPAQGSLSFVSRPQSKFSQTLRASCFKLRRKQGSVGRG